MTTDNRPDYEIAAEELAVFAEVHKLAARAHFVPFSKSKNAKTGWLSVNWEVTLEKDGRPVITTEYAQGTGHLKKPRTLTHSAERTVAGHRAIRDAIETGEGRYGRTYFPDVTAVPPTVVDVLSALAVDASAIDYARFEDWADEFGYDHDSRRVEGDYRACLETALKLRSALGEDGLARVRALAARL